MALAVIGAGAVRPLREGRVITDFSHIPMEMGDWSGIEYRFDDDTYRLLPSCSLLLRVYDHADIPPVELAIVYGTNLGDFHQPEQCLEGQGLRSLSKRIVQVKGEDGKTFSANGLIMDSEYGRRAYVYWFASGGTTATFLGSYKSKVILDRLLSRKVQPSALVRLSMNVLGDDDESINDLVKFAEAVVPYLNDEFSSYDPSQVR